MYPKIRYLLLVYLLLAGPQLFSQDRGAPLFRFGVIADVQYADQQHQGTRHYRASLQKLAGAVAVFNDEQVDFVVSLGDFIDADYTSYDTLTDITGKLKMPLYHVAGNHDFAVAEEQKDKVLQALKLKNDYYSFRKKNWRFIVLNGNDISLYGNARNSPEYKEAAALLSKLKAAGAPNAQSWNGTLSSDQRSWLEQELRAAARKKQQVVLLCHFPLLPEGSAHLLWQAAEIRRMLEAYPNVKAYLNGHVHASEHHTHKGVDYVTFRGMVEKEDNAFAIISVFKDHLEIKGYGKEVNRVLK